MEPKIRLKGFSGEWETQTLGSLGSVAMCKRIFKDQTSSKGDVPFFKIGTFGGTPDAFISRELYLEYKSRFNFPKKGDILISAAGTIGRAIEYQGDEAYFQDSNIVWLNHNDEITNPFLKQLYSIITWKGLEGATIKRLYNNIILETEINLPSKDEQQAIASYFQHLDSLIQSTTKKIESLKQVKAASLQSMFPQEGETTPRVRFKGFEGEWENKTLGECLTINNERNQSNVYGINDVLSVSDEVGVVNQIKLLGRSYAGKSVANYRVLKTNQIVYTKSPLKSKPYGIVKVNKGAVGIVSVLYAVYDTNENVYPDYIHYYFEPTHRINNYLLPLINKGAKNTMNISDEMALTGNIWIPSFDEQKKIADYLQALDSQIILQTQRLEKLKQIKSACLDNMFV